MGVGGGGAVKWHPLAFLALLYSSLCPYAIPLWPPSVNLLSLYKIISAAPRVILMGGLVPAV